MSSYSINGLINLQRVFAFNVSIVESLKIFYCESSRKSNNINKKLSMIV